MTKTSLILLATAPLLLAGSAVAQDAAENLVGTWVMTDFFGKSWRGTTITDGGGMSAQIEITEHDGPTFVGVLRWQLTTDEHGLHDGQQVTTDAEETILGVRDFDGDYIVVEHPDTSFRRFRFTNASTLEVVGYEAGRYAVVVRSTYARQ